MAADILEKLAAHAEERVAAAKKEVPLEEMMERAFAAEEREEFWGWL